MVASDATWYDDFKEIRKIMKYIVKARGSVIQKKSIAYAIEADSREEAEQKAKEKFNKAYEVSDNQLTVSGTSVNILSYVSLAALAIAVLIALIGFKAEGILKDKVIRPDLRSCLYGLGMYLVLLFKMKGIKTAFRSWIDIVLGILMSLVLGSLLQIMIAKVPFSGFFNLIKVDIRLVVLIIALIGMMGSSLLSLICLLIIAGLMTWSISHLTPVLMNFKGILYLACALTGTIAYLASIPVLYQAFMNLKDKIFK